MRFHDSIGYISFLFEILFARILFGGGVGRGFYALRIFCKVFFNDFAIPLVIQGSWLLLNLTLTSDFGDELSQMSIKLSGKYLYALTVCFYHVTFVFKSESTLYSCQNVKELLAWSRREIWSLSDCKWTRIHKHLVHKRTLNHLVKFFKVA